MKTNRSYQNKANRKSGKRSESIVKKALEHHGFVLVEPIETGWTIIRKFDTVAQKNVIVSAFPKGKVSGDFKAVEPGTGKAVHVEAKSRKDRLVFSALEKHQVEALDNIVAAGAIGFLAWTNGDDCRLYRWPIEGFGPGKSLKWGSVSL